MRLSGIAELRYTMLYGKSQVIMIVFVEFQRINISGLNVKNTVKLTKKRTVDDRLNN